MKAYEHTQRAFLCPVLRHCDVAFSLLLSAAFLSATVICDDCEKMYKIMTTTVDALGGTSFFLPAFFAFPFFTLPPCHQAIILNALIALVMRPQIRNRSFPTQDRGQAQGSRSRRARRLSPRCFPGQGWSVSVKTQKRSL